MNKVGEQISISPSGVEVREFREVRLLHVGGTAVQSAMYLKAPDFLAMPYARAMMAFLLFLPWPRNILIAGLGGGCIAKLLHRCLIQAHITAIEINPEVLDAARTWFGFPNDDARLQVIIDDAAKVIPQQPAGNVDVLMLDAFNDLEQIPALCTPEFYRVAFNVLSESGVLVANFMVRDTQLEEHLANMQKQFGRRPTRLLAEDGRNLIVLCFRGEPQPISWEHLTTQMQLASRQCGLLFEKLPAALRANNPHNEEYLFL